MRNMTSLLRLAIGALAGLATISALAQAVGAGFPDRPVRIIVGFPAGGTADAMPRIVAEKLSARWGQPVIIENRPGANGNIAAETLAKSPADGYTLMSGPTGPIVANQYLYKNLAFDQNKFVPVTILGIVPSVLDVRLNFPANSVQELVALAKARPGTLNYASSGNGSTPHLTAAMFEKMAGIKMVHVPYKGAAPALIDLVAGRIDVYFDNISSSLTQYRGGRIKILAVASLKRVAALPDVPTIDESGFPGFSSVSWNIVVGPEGLPAAVTQFISQAFAEALKLPDVQKKYADLSASIGGTSPAETAKFIAEEMARWRKVIQDANITAD